MLLSIGKLGRNKYVSLCFILKTESLFNDKQIYKLHSIQYLTIRQFLFVS